MFKRLDLKQQEFLSALESLKTNKQRLDWIYVEEQTESLSSSTEQRIEPREESDGIEMVTLNVEGVEYQQLRETRTKEELFAELENLTTNVEKFDLIKKVSKVKFPNFEDQDPKSDEVAEVYRKRGEQLFMEEKYEAAWMSFTSSLVVAKSNEQRALAYGDRSSVLFRWSLIKHCLTDIQRAIDNNYPNDRTEMLERRRRAKNRPNRPPRYHDPIPHILVPNPKIECADNVIRIDYNQQFGRHIVATKDIKIGDLILLEEPIVSMIFKGDFQHCHECCDLVYNPIPCDNCTQVVYCDEDCKIRAHEYHHYECAIIRKLKPELGMLDFLVLKLTLEMKEEYGHFNTLDENETYQSDRFDEVYNLQHNFDLAASKVLHKMVLFYRVLKKFTNFFESPYQRKAFKDLIIRNIGIDICNSKPLTEMRGSVVDTVEYGHGLFPAMSLFNHSCYPNVGIIHYGSTVALKAIQTIKKGEQCFICYKYRHERASIQIRRKEVPFCRCQPCVEKWPIGFETPRRTLSQSWIISVFADDVLNSNKLDFVMNSLWSSIDHLKDAEKTLSLQERSILCKTVDLCMRSYGNKRHY